METGCWNGAEYLGIKLTEWPNHTLANEKQIIQKNHHKIRSTLRLWEERPTDRPTKRPSVHNLISYGIYQIYKWMACIVEHRSEWVRRTTRHSLCFRRQQRHRVPNVNRHTHTLLLRSTRNTLFYVEYRRTLNVILTNFSSARCP